MIYQRVRTFFTGDKSEVTELSWLTDSNLRSQFYSPIKRHSRVFKDFSLYQRVRTFFTGDKNVDIFSSLQGWVSPRRNRFLPDIRKKLEERVFFHFLPFLPEETWKKVEETPYLKRKMIKYY